MKDVPQQFRSRYQLDKEENLETLAQQCADDWTALKQSLVANGSFVEAPKATSPEDEQNDFIKKIPIFDSLNNIEKYNIAEKITIMEYNVGDKIIDEDNPKDNETMFLIKSGSVKIEKHNKSLKTLGENEYFGVEKILLDSSYPIESHLTVRAIEVTVCYKLYKKDLIEAFGIGYKDILLFSIFKWCILHHTFFKDIFSEKYICSINNVNNNNYRCGFRHRLLLYCH